MGPDLTSLVEVEFDYVLANDFKVEMWSNLQTGTRPVPPPPLTNQVIEEAEPVLINIRRASGNIKDISNAQRVLFNYGLPSANMVAGFTIEGKNVWGFDFYGEWNNNLRYFQYPNAALFNANEGHEISSESGQATIFNLSKEAYPFFTYGEAYSVDADYSTSAFVSLPGGDVYYDDPIRSVYEFVADNDDQDRQPDWARVGSQANDREVFPGWDENLDFISDFNQNDNRSVPNSIPDYEEPFLRYHVDRPELLFGIDLNNNGWIDRFEDDELADYPYKPDRRGYNVFFGVHLLPEVRLLVGRLDERMLSDDRDNQTAYAMFTLDKDYPGLGRVRIFDMLKRVVDTIPDDRRAPLPFLDAPTPPLVSDMLFFPDTWINTAWLGVDYTAIANFEIVNKLKYERYSQAQEEARDIDGRMLAGSPSLLGLINKFEYKLHLGRFLLQPRLKSEYFRQDAFVRAEEDLKQWTGIASFLAQVPLLNSSVVDFGVELAQFNELVQQEEDMVEQGHRRRDRGFALCGLCGAANQQLELFGLQADDATRPTHRPHLHRDGAGGRTPGSSTSASKAGPRPLALSPSTPDCNRDEGALHHISCLSWVESVGDSQCSSRLWEASRGSSGKPRHLPRARRKYLYRGAGSDCAALVHAGSPVWRVRPQSVGVHQLRPPSSQALYQPRIRGRSLLRSLRTPHYARLASVRLAPDKTTNRREFLRQKRCPVQQLV